MPTERDSFVLVPDADRSALLVAGGTLPCVRSRSGAAGVIEALRKAYALEAPYMRPARIIPNEDSREAGAALYEFDAPNPHWEPRADLTWLGLAGVDPEALAPPELAPYVEKWLALMRGATISDARAPWARSGWLAEASAWLDASIAEAGLQPTGPVEVVEQWPLSSVLRRPTDGGHVYMKAVFSLFRHEPVLTQALGAEHPTLVPEVLAVDVTRGWMLMRELPGTQVGDLEVERWCDALRPIGVIHREWAGRADELFALGAHDRTLHALATEIGAAFEGIGLAIDDRTVSRLERACRDLGSGPLRETLVHGDLHPWNVMADGDDMRIFDWSDACVSLPLFDLPTFLMRADASAREQLLDSYLEAWRDVASLEELRAAYESARPLAHVHHGISYLRIHAAHEPDDRWWFDDAPREWLEGAIEAQGVA